MVTGSNPGSLFREREAATGDMSAPAPAPTPSFAAGYAAPKRPAVQRMTSDEDRLFQSATSTAADYGSTTGIVTPRATAPRNPWPLAAPSAAPRTPTWLNADSAAPAALAWHNADPYAVPAAPPGTPWQFPTSRAENLSNNIIPSTDIIPLIIPSSAAHHHHHPSGTGAGGAHSGGWGMHAIHARATPTPARYNAWDSVDVWDDRDGRASSSNAESLMWGLMGAAGVGGGTNGGGGSVMESGDGDGVGDAVDSWGSNSNYFHNGDSPGVRFGAQSAHYQAQQMGLGGPGWQGAVTPALSPSVLTGELTSRDMGSRGRSTNCTRYQADANPFITVRVLVGLDSRRVSTPLLERLCHVG